MWQWTGFVHAIIMMSLRIGPPDMLLVSRFFQDNKRKCCCKEGILSRLWFASNGHLTYWTFDIWDIVKECPTWLLYFDIILNLMNHHPYLLKPSSINQRYCSFTILGQPNWCMTCSFKPPCHVILLYAVSWHTSIFFICFLTCVDVLPNVQTINKQTYLM